jgi:small nuclear ribonucleoprotein (snRNP)-like protein
MRKVLFVLLLLTCSFDLFAKDVVVLKDGSKIKGSLISVDQHEIILEKSKKSGEHQLKFTPEEVEFVMVENLEKLKEIQDSMYLKGIGDAKIHHRRFGGNFCAGFFGGAIGFIIVAVSDAKEPNIAIVGEESYKNLEYRAGYNQKAKSKNLAAAGVGWAVGFVVLLVLLSPFNGQ